MSLYKEIFSKDKLTRQELAEAVGSLHNQHNHFLFNVVMRTGKSLLFTTLCNNWLSEYLGNKKILILTNSEATNKQWQENLEKYNPHLVDKVDIYCYHSLHKLDREGYFIIGLDEYELSRSEKRESQIHEFIPEHWIAMSGTLGFEDKQSFRLLTSNKFFEIKVDLAQAVQWGILPQPKVYAVPLEFNNTNRYLVYQKGKDKTKDNVVVPYNERWNIMKDRSINKLIQCTELEYNSLLEEDYNFASAQFTRVSSQVNKTKWLMAGNKRKMFYGSIKPQHFKKLFKQLPENARCLIFCVDTAQADLLNEEFAVHSNRPGSLSLVEEFNNKHINKLFTVRQLDRGVDFVDVDYVIIIQLAGKAGSPTQQMGRSLLSTAPKIITFYYPGTQDEKYLQNFLEQFNPEWIIKKKLS